jgi:hypothetical protein
MPNQMFQLRGCALSLRLHNYDARCASQYVAILQRAMKIYPASSRMIFNRRKRLY